MNTFLVALDSHLSGHITWSVFPLLGWGIGLAFDTAETFLRHTSDYEKGFSKWRKRRRQGQ